MIGISTRKREKIWEKIDVELDCRGNEIKLKSNQSGGEVESGIRTGVDLDEIGSQELKPISRFALSQHEIKNLEDEKILLSRDTLQISTSRIGAGHFGNVYKGI
jgi:chorismate synthase